MGLKANELSRNVGIDAVKFFCIVAVILIHTGPSYYSGPHAVSFIRTVFGLAVPFFFIASGYFFGKALAKEAVLMTVYTRYLKRLVIVFAGWSLLYSLPRLTSDLMLLVSEYGWLKAYYWYYTETFQFKPVYYLMGGTAGHLWFLSALIQALTIMTIFLSLREEKLLIYFSLLLFLLAPVINLHFQLGIREEYTWNPVAGPFVATAFVVSGWWLSKRKIFSIKWAVALVILGMLISWAQERLWIAYYHFFPVYSDYGRLLVAMGLFIVPLYYSKFCENTFLPLLGQLTLGIYCSHILFIDLFSMIKEKLSPLTWDFIVPVLVFFLAWGLTLLLRKIPLLRNLVT